MEKHLIKEINGGEEVTEEEKDVMLFTYQVSGRTTILKPFASFPALPFLVDPPITYRYPSCFTRNSLSSQGNTKV